KQSSSTSSEMTIFLASIVLLAGNFYRLGGRNEATYIDGAKQTAKIFLQDTSIHSFYAIHQLYPFQQYLPQLNYYTDGLLLEWDSTKKGKTLTFEQADSMLK